MIANQLGEKGIRFFSQYVEQIPIPQISIELQQPFEVLVDKILAGKARGEDTREQEAEIDARVFQLYGLGEQEMIDVLQSIATVSEGERREIQAEYRRLGREKK